MKRSRISRRYLPCTPRTLEIIQRPSPHQLTVDLGGSNTSKLAVLRNITTGTPRTFTVRTTSVSRLGNTNRVRPHYLLQKLVSARKAQHPGRAPLSRLGWGWCLVFCQEKLAWHHPSIDPLIHSLSGCSFLHMSWSSSKTCQDLICIKGISMVSRIQVISVLWGWSQRFIFDRVSLNDQEGHLRWVFQSLRFTIPTLSPFIYVMLSLWCSFTMAARLIFSWFISWTRADKQTEIMPSMWSLAFSTLRNTIQPPLGLSETPLLISESFVVCYKVAILVCYGWKDMKRQREKTRYLLQHDSAWLQGTLRYYKVRVIVSRGLSWSTGVFWGAAQAITHAWADSTDTAKSLLWLSCSRFVTINFNRQTLHQRGRWASPTFWLTFVVSVWASLG